MLRWLTYIESEEWGFIFHSNSYILLFKFLFGSLSVLSSRFAGEVSESQGAAVMCSLWYIHLPDFFSHYCWCNTLLRVENCMQCSAWNVWRPHSYIPPAILSRAASLQLFLLVFLSLVMSKSGRKTKLVFLTMPLCSGERFAKWWTEVWSG